MKTEDRVKELEGLINHPELEDWLKGVQLEAAHQVERWGKEHDAKKYPHDFVLVFDYLKGKLAQSIWNRDEEKFKHHLITLAAVCFNAHKQFKNENSGVHHFFKQSDK